MKKLSSVSDDTFFKTSKEQMINNICSNTGLSRDITTEIFESLKSSGMTNEIITTHFENLTKPKGIITADDFHQTLVSVLDNKEIQDSKKIDFTERFLQLLSDNTSIENTNYIDSVNLISIVKDILVTKNPEAEQLLSGIITTSDLSKTDFRSLNESLNMIIPSENNENTVKLYEGLKIILAKNNRRWGNAYHLDNAHERINQYIDKQLEKIQLDSSIISYDDTYHLVILNEFLTDNVNPIYKNFSSVRELVNDTQTLVFDMILLINKFMSGREYDLQFISKQTYNQYIESGQALIAMLNSSSLSSKILDVQQIKNLRNPKISSDNDDTGEYSTNYQSLLDYYTNSIDSRKLKHTVYNIGLKGIVDMLNFIKSASFEFNLKIRPVIRTYINQAYELTSKVEKARILREKAKL